MSLTLVRGCLCVALMCFESELVAFKSTNELHVVKTGCNFVQYMNNNTVWNMGLTLHMISQADV